MPVQPLETQSQSIRGYNFQRRKYGQQLSPIFFPLFLYPLPPIAALFGTRRGGAPPQFLLVPYARFQNWIAVSQHTGGP